MDYVYEALGHDRFQRLCAALLTKEHPNVQCFPTGQADGGRDVVSYNIHKGHKDFIAFQVKYTEAPDRVDDPYTWVEALIREEVPKVQRLKERGLSAYYILSNVRGTGRLDTGTIDRVQKLLDDSIPVPAQCLWRGDLDRRLDAALDIKWSYPEVLTGRDVLGLLVGARLTEDRDRRLAALRSYIRTQYEADQKVRFKQIELQNDLLSLFVDVPIGIRRLGGTAEKARKDDVLLTEVVRSASEHARSSGDQFATAYLDDNADTILISQRAGYQRESVGAAALLLSASAQTRLPRMVLEGAPGQGKSTLAQYICQIHRIRVLSGSAVLEDPSPSPAVPVRLPFKADLRDVATWLGGSDPFSSKPDSGKPPGWEESVETFLAAQIHHFSGGVDFGVADLHAVVHESPVLLVFDGLDEVADISARRKIVEHVTLAVKRLEESALSVQVVVTSRPAAYANSPGFADDYFRYGDLLALTRPLIDHYARRWAVAKGLVAREEKDLNEILASKLSEPHMRDLARNPMQLSILLSLIHTRGASLPDKRTALYDNYVELFLNRESEKSTLVRQHRDLLVDIHRYLAWVLHSEAERGNTRGSISRDSLITLLREYLRKEGRDPKLAELLFQGMVERVVALVSRVQGTYEFEVQPLREYFCARHLYETAPYSPPGSERVDTKLDRFDAIARNFYWFNVARFLAGCFSKGELPALVSSIKDLVGDPEYGLISHPRVLGVTLIGDWVFAQHVRSMEEILDLVMEPSGIRLALSSGQRRRPFVLPESRGRQLLGTRCKAILDSEPPDEYAVEVIGLLRSNLDKDELAQWWEERTLATRGRRRTKWFQYGGWLNLLAGLTVTQVSGLLADQYDRSHRIAILLDAGHVAYFDARRERIREAIDAVLDSGRWGALTLNEEHPLLKLASVLSLPRHMEFMYQTWYAADLLRLSGSPARSVQQPAEKYGASAALLRECSDFANEMLADVSRGPGEWSRTGTSWDHFIERARSNWGDHWAIFLLANVGAGYQSRPDNGFPDLLDKRSPLFARTRYARLKGTKKWWQDQITRARARKERQLVSLVSLTWADASLLRSLIRPLNDLLQSLSQEDFDRLIRALKERPWHSGRGSGADKLDANDVPKSASPRLVLALAERSSDGDRTEFYSRFLTASTEAEKEILRFRAECEFTLAIRKPDRWPRAMQILSSAYTLGLLGLGPVDQRHRYGSQVRRFRLPKGLARQILGQVEKHPAEVLGEAEGTLRASVARRLVPVGQLAADTGWFKQ